MRARMAKAANPLTAAPELRKDVVRAIQAITAYSRYNGQGEAPGLPSPRDCQIALDWIIQEAGRYYDNGFAVDDPNGRQGAFFDGRQFVAKNIVMAMQIKPELLDK